MAQTNIYYRPIWTCGRYNEKAQAAIYYNLIAGMSYFFESYSAMVVGEILSVARNGTMDLENIAMKLNIAMESLTILFTTNGAAGSVGYDGDGSSGGAAGKAVAGTVTDNRN